MTSAAPPRTHDGKIVLLASVGNYCVSLAARTLFWWWRDRGTVPNVGLVAPAGRSGRCPSSDVSNPSQANAKKGFSGRLEFGPGGPASSTRKSCAAPPRRQPGAAPLTRWGKVVSGSLIAHVASLGSFTQAVGSTTSSHTPILETCNVQRSAGDCTTPRVIVRAVE